MGGRGGAARSSGTASWQDSVPATQGNDYPEYRPVTGEETPRARAAEAAIIDSLPGLPDSFYPGWKSISDVRDALSRRGFSVAEQDAGLSRLATNPTAKQRVAKVANLKIVDSVHRRGSIRLGNEWKHAVTSG